MKHLWSYRAQERLVLTNCLGSGVGNVERDIQLVRMLGETLSIRILTLKTLVVTAIEHRISVLSLLLVSVSFPPFFIVYLVDRVKIVVRGYSVKD